MIGDVKKIALIGTTAGSMLNFRRALIRLLVREGHAVYAFCCDYTPETHKAMRELGAEPVSYSAARTGMNPFADIYTIYDLYRLLRQIKPATVFSYFTKPIIYGTLVAKWLRIPRVVGMLEGLGYAFTEIPGESPTLKARVLKFIQVCWYKLTLPLLDELILLNKQDAEDLLAKYKIKVKKCGILGPIGVDFEKFTFSEPPHDPLTFLFVGRLLKEKGIHLYVDAARCIHAKHPHVRFVVAGGLDTNPGGLSKYEIEDLAAEGVIDFVGHVDDMPDLYRQATILVLPSYREGYSLSVQEAMASGRAVITSDAPGCQGTVFEGETGLTHKNGDVMSLIETLMKYVDLPELANVHGRNAREFAMGNYDSQTNSQLLAKIL